MKILSDLDREGYEALPEDVRAVLSLFPDNYIFETGGGMRSKYIDIWDENASDYFFQQDYNHPEVSKARFISWVRHGMQEGYNELDGGDATEENQWRRED